MAKKLVKLTESDLHRIIKETAERILNESNNGLFDVYSNDSMGNAPVFVYYDNKCYLLPQEMRDMLYELGTRGGRVEFLNELINIQPLEKPMDAYSLKLMGYKRHSFNANAF